MSRYKCNQCETEHGTDNMVSYCASCYDVLKKRLEAAMKFIVVVERWMDTGDGPTYSAVYDARKEFRAHSNEVENE